MYAERTEIVRLAEALNAIGVALGSAHGVEPIARVLADDGMRVIGCESASWPWSKATTS